LWPSYLKELNEFLHSKDYNAGIGLFKIIEEKIMLELKNILKKREIVNNKNRKLLLNLFIDINNNNKKNNINIKNKNEINFIKYIKQFFFQNKNLKNKKNNNRFLSTINNNNNNIEDNVLLDDLEKIENLNITTIEEFIQHDSYKGFIIIDNIIIIIFIIIVIVNIYYYC
jgi:hypothetical protein